jgi:hypothetical protein
VSKRLLQKRRRSKVAASVFGNVSAAWLLRTTTPPRRCGRCAANEDRIGRAFSESLTTLDSSKEERQTRPSSTAVSAPFADGAEGADDAADADVLSQRSE